MAQWVAKLASVSKNFEAALAAMHRISSEPGIAFPSPKDMYWENSDLRAALDEVAMLSHHSSQRDASLPLFR